MKRSLILIAVMMICQHISLWAQPAVTQSEETALGITKTTTCKTYSFNGRSYFALNIDPISNDPLNLVKISADGRSIDNIAIRYEVGTFKNMNTLNTLGSIGNTSFILLENRNKEEGKNTLSMSTFSENGKVGAEKKNIGSIPYSKMINPGDWLTYITPDKKHIAIVSVYPAEKGEAQKGQYFFLDESFTVLSSGDLNIPSTSDKKKSYNFSLYASDKGDIYLVNSEFEKSSSYFYPVVYRKAAAEKDFTMFEVLLKQPYTPLKDYVGAITPTGSLLLGGYTKEKKTFTIGETQSKGVWFYNSDNPTATIIHDFEKSTGRMKAFGILCNNNTAFLVGEQVNEEKEPKSPSAGPFDENYTYEYNDIMITGNNLSDDSKFDIVLPRKLRGRNITADLNPSFGIVNGKICIIYNDELKKYLKDAGSYKVPVMVTITPEGLMERPSHFEKAFDTGNTGYDLFTGFSVFTNNQVTVLSSNGRSIKAATFK